MPPAEKSHAQTDCPPPHTVLHGWGVPELQRNGDLVVPLVNAAGEKHGLRGTQQAWREFVARIQAALAPAGARGSVRKPRTDAARAAAGQPIPRPRDRR